MEPTMKKLPGDIVMHKRENATYPTFPSSRSAAGLVGEPYIILTYPILVIAIDLKVGGEMIGVIMGANGRIGYERMVMF